MKERTRTQADIGNYPTGFYGSGKEQARTESYHRSNGTISVLDAAWLWALAGIAWDSAPPQQYNHDDEVMKQAVKGYRWKTFDALKEAIHQGYMKIDWKYEADPEERRVDEWIAGHRLRWLKLFGQDIAKRLEECIRRNLTEDKLRCIGPHHRIDMLEALEKETAHRIEQHEDRRKPDMYYQVGYDQAQGPDTTAYAMLLPDGTRHKATVTGRIGAWVRLQTNPQSDGHWYLEGPKGCQPANPYDSGTLEKEWENRRRLERIQDDQRNWKRFHGPFPWDRPLT